MKSNIYFVVPNPTSFMTNPANKLIAFKDQYTDPMLSICYSILFLALSECFVSLVYVTARKRMLPIWSISFVGLASFVPDERIDWLMTDREKELRRES